MSFQFPSLSALAQGALSTVKRFPMPLAAAFVATGIGIYLVELKGDVEKENEYLLKVVMCCWLGLNLFLALTLYSERKGHAVLPKYILQAIGLVLVAGYYFLLPDFNSITISDGMRFALFSIGLHLLVSFSPFIVTAELNGFWQFNKSLFLRFLLSALYSGVLYAGLALALVAIDQLFAVHLRGERFAQLWFFMAGVFNTWFFLSGVPEKPDELEASADYPKGLKVFTQFVLLPLVAFYLVIIYAYGLKILGQWELPKGWVSWLVNALSVFGILSLLLIWPIRNNEGNKWISTFGRWFYLALFPLIILLGFAIGKRVIDYGITENRYFVLVVALWLAGIASYFLISKVKNIKLIPITLCILAFLSSFGPWGAFGISERSQVNRLERMLTEENILVDGKIKKATDTISNKNGRQIVSIVKYLADHHGFDGIKPWFNENLDTLLAPKDGNEYVYKPAKILALMGVEDNYNGGYYDEDDTARVEAEKGFDFYVKHDQQKAISVIGFDYSCVIDRNVRGGEEGNLIHIGNDSLDFIHSDSTKQYALVRNGVDSLYFDLDEFVRTISAYNKESRENEYDSNIPVERMVLEAHNDQMQMKLYITNISGVISSEKVVISNVNGTMLVKLGRDASADKATKK